MLLREFDAVADAPDGVQRLRELVLQLAVRGKLVPQDPKDEPASVLLEHARVEYASMVKSGQIGKCKESIREDARGHYDLPCNWRWTRLGEVVAVLDSRRVPVKEAEREARVAGKPITDLVPYYGATQRVGWIDDFIFDEELVLLGEDGAPFFRDGKHVAYIINGKSWVNNHAHVLRGLAGISNVYLSHVLNVANYHGYVAGTTRLKLTQGKMVDLPVPLPPLPEQRRIVEKVDQLMALCDELEERQRRRVQKRDRLNRAALHHLNTAADDGELTHTWARIRENFELLYDAPETVTELRQAVLQLAVRGKLVPQDPSDEPASALLERIEAEKKRLHAEGKIGKPSKLPAIKSEEVPFRVPEGWKWARFGEVSINRDAERVPVSSVIRETRQGKHPYYGASGVIDYIDDYLFDERLLLIGEDGANLILRSTPIAFFADGQYWVNNHAHVIDAVDDDLLDYLALFINATDLRPYVTGTAQPKLNQAKLNSIPIALPPLPEQRRIVTKVNQLMALCDGLEARLTTARTKSAHLAASVMHHLTAA
jgi:type I restriction enzyme S subunit